ncbi:hypothetical protein C4J93_1309 [Pseudomonas sp. R2-37-08W]|uniref:hypothetical protein n=1 Tax=Pseudomonas sp. R2-37-08W TaxID=1173273 RepID=UPI000F575AE9|nr:hypothetical protein [Pseudomonas sp. R2-37-08W]AZF09523.1 hypothetical protein C4J93_1309 [Pseudomonas sp. R2-37-08W]
MSKVIQTVEELDAVLHWRGKHSIVVRERDGLQLSLNTADQTIDDLSAAVSRRTKRVRDLEAQLAYAVDALNEVVKASAMHEKPFEIATLAIGEMSSGLEQPAPVAAVTINYGALDPVKRLAVCRGEQAAVVLPERKALPEVMMATWHEAKGWNACLDELKRLNPSL